jgi:hypothetical protein
MSEAVKHIVLVIDGFFYFFGFIENPTNEVVRDIMKDSPSEKIKADLRRVNSDYRKQLNRFRKEVLSLG